MEFKNIRVKSKVRLEERMINALNQINKKLCEVLPFGYTEFKVCGVENIIKLALVLKEKEVIIQQVDE